MTHHILLVEDDDGIALPLVRALTREGYTVQREAAGEPAIQHARTQAPCLIILDLGLPDVDGLEVCRLIREDSFNGAIMILTARGAEIDRVVGLDVGADDYMAKPFGLAELLARVRALMRRSQPVLKEGLQKSPASEGGSVSGRASDRDGRIAVDSSARQAFVRGSELPLTAKEFDVLALIEADRGAVVSREKLMEYVWDTNWFGSTKTLDVTVGRLRQKLESAQCVSRIVTVRGVGFRLEENLRDA